MPYLNKKTKLWTGRIQRKGFPQKKKRGFKTKTAAKKWEQNILESILHPQIVFLTSQISLKYLKYCQKRFKLNTYRQKTFILKSFLLSLQKDISIETISLSHVENYLDDMYEVKGGKKANRDLRELGTFFNWVIQRDYLSSNPCQSVEKYHEDPFIKYVPPAEDIQTILEIATQFEKDIILVAYHALARAGEIRSIKPDDCDFENDMLTLWTRKRKGGSLEPDQIEMNKTLKSVLSRYAVNAVNYIFERNEKQLSKNSLDKVLPKLCKKAGIKPFTFHSIRHHVATLLATRLSLLEVQKALRHKRATTTDIYLRSLVKIETKGVHVLDDLCKRSRPENIIPFQKTINQK